MGTYEEKVRRVVDAKPFDMPAISDLRGSLDAMISVIPSALQPDGWKGATADAAKSTADSLVECFRQVNTVLTAVETTIVGANAASAKAAAALESLPGVSVDPRIIAAAKDATHFNFMGVEIKVDGAVDTIAGILTQEREKKAAEIDRQLEKDLSAQSQDLGQARDALRQIDGFDIPPVSDDPTPTPEGSNPPPSPRSPRGPSYPTPDTGGGLYGTGGGGGDDFGVLPDETGGAYHPPTGPRHPIIISDPTFPVGPPPTSPTGPTPDGTLGDGNLPDTGTGPGGSGSTGGGGGGGLNGGLGSGLVGGGAGAAALAAAKLGGGSAGGLGGGRGLGLGGGAGAGGRLGGGGGLLGGSGSAGSAGGAGTAGATTGAAAGGRGAPGMMGGGAGGGSEDREKRSGLGGPLAPKLDDEDEKAPRSTGASAGGRTPRAEK